MTLATPAGVLETIEKTVGYVVKNGPSFEERLRANGGEKFSFLHPQDEHHQVYIDKRDTALKTPSKPTNTQQQQSTLLKSANLPKHPNSEEEQKAIVAPAPFRFTSQLPAISAIDLDIIKLTALFCSQNEGYAAKIQNKYKNEPQFDFLRSGHSFNTLFLQYVDQYQRVPDATGPEQDVLTLGTNRARYEKMHRAKAEDAKRQRYEKQVAYASIDWQDFTIVGNVLFDDVDKVKELAVPLRRDELVFRELGTKSDEIHLEIAKPAPVPESELEPAEKSARPAGISSVPKGMKIRAAGTTRLKRAAAEPTITCPFTAQQIAESKFDNHLKVLLRDPRYKEQQDNYMKKNFSYASNLTTDQVYDNIKRMAMKRSSEESQTVKKTKSIGPGHS